MSKRSGRLATILVVLVAFGLGAVWGIGYRHEVRRFDWTVTELCSDGCAGGFYVASYGLLECRYARLLREDGVKRFITSGWRGDLGIGADRMSNGMPFPPALPAYRQLTAQEAANVTSGDSEELCPLLYDGRSAVASEPAPPLHGYQIPVIDG